MSIVQFEKTATTHDGNTAAGYNDTFDHIIDELEKLDCIIRLAVVRIRKRLEQHREKWTKNNLYISHDEVDVLLGRSDECNNVSDKENRIQHELAKITSDIGRKIEASFQQGILLTLPQLAHYFTLSPAEISAVIICLAPELDRKYDRLYAYLQDDITRMKPSIDLVLQLLFTSEKDRWAARSLFVNNAPLFRSGILDRTDDLQNPSGSSDLSRFIKISDRILSFILGYNSVDERLKDRITVFAPSDENQWIIDDDLFERIFSLVNDHFKTNRNTENLKLILYLYGTVGTGKRETARKISQNMRCTLIEADLEMIVFKDSDFDTLLRALYREALLLQSFVFLYNCSFLVKDDIKSKLVIRSLKNIIAEYGWLTILSGESPWHDTERFGSIPFYIFEFPLPCFSLRETFWKKHLARELGSYPKPWPQILANRYKLTSGTIGSVLQEVSRDPNRRSGSGNISLDDISSACRNGSHNRLQNMAVRIKPSQTWNSLILPENTLSHLKEICSHVRHNFKVFHEWGFDDRLSYGKGLSILFSGPSGTGKTLSAEVMARDLNLELYKIDLSAVVSKYIGETEKNLAAIFKEAESGNVILFFDEADALFGKRTHVSDAHDRYANIETSYLLQRIEMNEGMVILATNLRENIDDAFKRRIRFIIEFPFPDTRLRENIWNVHFPEKTPVCSDIDFSAIAEEFEISGGNIKNVVLNAAFFAAQNEQEIGVHHLLKGMRREYEKIGKIWNDEKFKKSDKFVKKLHQLETSHVQ